MIRPSRWVMRGVFLIWLMVPAGVGAVDIDPQAARDAIERAVAALKRLQGDRGNWPDVGGNPGGTTALSALAMLNAGVPPSDPSLSSALEYLRRLGNPKVVYPTALQTMVFCLADPEKYRLLIRRNVSWLEQLQATEEGIEGGWGYHEDRPRPDNSNSQFAVLALHEAARVGVTVDRRVWERVQTYWEAEQLKDGSWPYRGSNGKGSMTCAGISSLIIAGRHLSEGDAFVLDGNVVCCGAQRDSNAVAQGLGWMGRNFAVSYHPASDTKRSTFWLYYYLYGVERAGRLSGSRYLGQHDWYREGVEFLLEQQTIKGEWETAQYASYPSITTSFGLLFLAKGKRPVVMSKLQHAAEFDWNRHRHDVNNLTQHIEKLWERDLTWQIVDIRRASVSDLLQSPVLFLSGRDALPLTTDQKQTLKQYIEQGGFLFAEACCGGEAFDQQFRELMRELFPKNGLRLLPPDHPVWYAETRVDSKFLRPLWGLDSCCRTSVVYCPGNLGCFWELARGQGLEYPVNIQNEIDAVLGIGANVVAYATNRELREKLDVPTIVIEQDVDNPTRRGALRVAKLQHAGGSDDAPSSVANLLRIAESEIGLLVDTRHVVIPATDASLPDYPILYVHGRRDFQLSEEQRKAIAEFVNNGGVLFADAICASPEFSMAFRREMKSIFPDETLRPIPPTDPIFSDTYKGFDLKTVRIRRLSGKGQPGSASRIETSPPRLEAIEQDGRHVVIFSPLDLSCALESSASTDCEGYVSEDAARIGINVLLYALQE